MGQLWAEGRSTLQLHQQRLTPNVKAFLKTAVLLPPDHLEDIVPGSHPSLGEAGRQTCVKEMLLGGQIEPSDSPWASPVVLVTKKDGSTRFCVEYRRLNSLTIKDAYPRPRIDDLLRLLGNQQWFSTMDLASGYWQMAMSPEAKRKAAFVTNKCLFQFRVMPFGLCNAPATFERLMDRVLCRMRWSQCLVLYLDDVISSLDLRRCCPD